MSAPRSMVAVTCSGCGGAVAALPGHELPRCLFCGSLALMKEEAEEIMDPPEVWLPFQVSREEAGEAFRRFARSSIWYPGDLADSVLKLEPLFVPAWAWAGTVETHYAALISAATRSGKRPSAGSATLSADDILVLASTSLTPGELGAISPYTTDHARPFDSEALSVPYELGRLSRRASAEKARQQLSSRHGGQLSKATGALTLRAAHLYSDLDGRPLLLPVYIGTYRHGDRFWRVVLNGQTGRITGRAPISVAKVLLALGLGLAVLLVIFLALALT